jgi:regulator of sigma E protease
MIFTTIIIFLVVLAVLVVVHELGHFLAARAFGIRVDEFGLGFGPRLFGKSFTSKKHGTTIYTLNAIPFGGFVKIFGESPDADSISGPDSSRSFVNKPRWVQATVLAAGVVSNFIFAWIIVSLGFMAGLPVSPESYTQYANRIENVRVLVASVDAGSPAEKAGLAAGDTLAVPSIEALQSAIAQSHGNPVLISYKPVDINAPTSTVSITPVQGIIAGQYAIGVVTEDAATLRLPVFLAVWEGGKFTIHMMTATAQGIYALLVGLFQGDRSVLSQVSGPVGIANLVGQAAHIGFVYLLVFTALISVNLGVLNLVPFPALDGGRILFVIIESVIRRPIKPAIANTINGIGFALLLLLMAVVTCHDIFHLIFTKGQ